MQPSVLVVVFGASLSPQHSHPNPNKKSDTATQELGSGVDGGTWVPGKARNPGGRRAGLVEDPTSRVRPGGKRVALFLLWSILVRDPSQPKKVLKRAPSWGT